MIKRPINPRFNDAVRSGRKFTTIRDKPWPVSVPIMLYNWSGPAYRSPQINVCAIEVTGYWPILISQREDGSIHFEHGMENDLPLYSTEGFSTQQELEDWFRPLIKPRRAVCKTLMRFKIWNESEDAKRPKAKG